MRESEYYNNIANTENDKEYLKVYRIYRILLNDNLRL